MMLFFPRWILVTSLVGALAVNFFSPNFTLHASCTNNSKHVVYAIIITIIIITVFFYIIYKQYNIIFCDYTFYYFYLK